MGKPGVQALGPANTTGAIIIPTGGTQPRVGSSGQGCEMMTGAGPVLQNLAMKSGRRVP